MSKHKEQVQETWGSRMKDFGGGNFTFVSTDGEALTFIVVGLPEMLIGKYKGKEQQRIGCPVVTEEGYQLFVTGKRVGRKLAKQSSKFGTNAIMVIRHGAEGDINATYEVKVVEEPETYARLRLIADQDFDPSMIEESIEEALKVMNG